MKIAYFVPYITHSGPVNVVNYLTQELSKEHKVDVFYFKNIHNAQFFVDTYQIGFFDLIDFDKYDILHSHGIIPDAYLWWHKKSIKKALCITTMHNYIKEDHQYAYHPIKAQLMVKIWKSATAKHERVVTLSKDALAYYENFWLNKNLVYAYNGIPKEIEKHNIYTLPVGNPNHIKMGLIGSSNTSRIKGFDQVIYGLKKLENCSLYVSGEGVELQRLERLAKELGVAQRVYFVGYVEDIASFIDAIDIFVVPSRSEGFSLALQEIVRGKKPVACSDIEIFRELFDASAVMKFALDDVESFVTTIKRVEKESESLVHQAYEKFEQCYTSQHMARRYLDIYKQAIDDRNAGLI